MMFFLNDVDKYFFINTIYFRLHNCYLLRQGHAAVVSNEFN